MGRGGLSKDWCSQHVQDHACAPEPSAKAIQHSGLLPAGLYPASHEGLPGAIPGLSRLRPPGHRCTWGGSCSGVGDVGGVGARRKDHASLMRSVVPTPTPTPTPPEANHRNGPREPNPQKWGPQLVKQAGSVLLMKGQTWLPGGMWWLLLLSLEGCLRCATALHWPPSHAAQTTSASKQVLDSHSREHDGGQDVLQGRERGSVGLFARGLNKPVGSRYPPSLQQSSWGLHESELRGRAWSWGRHSSDPQQKHSLPCMHASSCTHA